MIMLIDADKALNKNLTPIHDISFNELAIEENTIKLLQISTKNIQKAQLMVKYSF